MNKTQNKRKFSFNIIDAALIIIALVSIVSLIYFVSEKDIASASGDEQVLVEYQIEIRGVREEFVNLVNIGDKIVSVSVMENIGEVISVTNSEYIYEGTNSLNGEKVEAPHPTLKTMIIKVSATAAKTEYGYLINGHDLVIGSELQIRVPDFTGNGICTSITELK